MGIFRDLFNRTRGQKMIGDGSQDESVVKQNKLIQIDYANIKKYNFITNSSRQIYIKILYNDNTEENLLVGEIFGGNFSLEDIKKLQQDLRLQMDKAIHTNINQIDEQSKEEILKEEFNDEKKSWNQNNARFHIIDEGKKLLYGKREIEKNGIIKEDSNEIKNNIIIDYEKILNEGKYNLQEVKTMYGTPIIALFWQTSNLDGLEYMSLATYDDKKTDAESVKNVINTVLTMYSDVCKYDRNKMQEAYYESFALKSEKIKVTEEAKEAFKRNCIDRQKIIPRQLNLNITDEIITKAKKEISEKQRASNKEFKEGYRKENIHTTRSEPIINNLLSRELLDKILNSHIVEVNGKSNNEIDLMAQDEIRIIEKLRKSDMFMSVGQDGYEEIIVKSLGNELTYKRGEILKKKYREKDEKGVEDLKEEEKTIDGTLASYFGIRRDKKDTNEQKEENKKEFNEIENIIKELEVELERLKDTFENETTKEKRKRTSEDIFKYKQKKSDIEREIKLKENRYKQLDYDLTGLLAGHLRVKSEEYINSCRHLFSRYNIIARENGGIIYNLDDAISEINGEKNKGEERID